MYFSRKISPCAKFSSTISGWIYKRSWPQWICTRHIESDIQISGISILVKEKMTMTNGTTGKYTFARNIHEIKFLWAKIILQVGALKVIFLSSLVVLTDGILMVMRTDSIIIWLISLDKDSTAGCQHFKVSTEDCKTYYFSVPYFPGRMTIQIICRTMPGRSGTNYNVLYEKCHPWVSRRLLSPKAV